MYDGQPLPPPLSCCTLDFLEAWSLSTLTTKPSLIRWANPFTNLSCINPYSTAGDSKSAWPHVRCHLGLTQFKILLIFCNDTKLSSISSNQWTNASSPLKFMSQFEQHLLLCSKHVAPSFRIQFTRIKLSTFANQISNFSFIFRTVEEHLCASTIAVSNLPEEHP